MYRYLGQPKSIAVRNTFQHIGFELFLRQESAEKFRLPPDFMTLTPDDLAAPLALALKPLSRSIQFISINLEPFHFIADDFIDLVTTAQNNYQTHLVVELVERDHHLNVTSADLDAAAAKYQAAGIGVCLDHVGFGSNVASRADLMDPHVSEYKLVLQDFNFDNIAEIEEPLMFWYHRAQEQKKDLAIVGIETQAEFDYINAHCPGVILQGYYFARPALLPISI